MQRAYVRNSLSSRLVISNSLAVFLFLMAGLAAAQSAVPAATNLLGKGRLSQPTRPTKNSKAAPTESGRKAMTPFDRSVRPGLKSILQTSKRSKTNYRAARAVKPGPAPVANFGGFVAAPKFRAYNSAGQDTAPISVFTNGDFNKDGQADIVTVQNSGAINTLLNQGSGRFSPVITTPARVTNNIGGAIQAIAADVNKDGFDDLVLLDGANNAVDILIGNQDGTFGLPRVVSLTDYYASSIAMADLNGDGFPDLVVVGSNVTFDANFNPTTIVEMDTFVNNQQGGFYLPNAARKQILSYPGFYQTLIGKSVVLTDVNGDGVADATVEILQFLDTDNPSEQHLILTFLGTTNGVFQAANQANNIVIPAEGTFNIGYPLIANLNVVDVNHDGFKDVVFSYQDYNIYVALGNGDGTYQFYSNVGAFQAYPTDLMVADIKGNGYPDLIDAEPGYLAVYPNRGDGTFDTSTIINYGSGMGQWSVLAVTDFTGDGTPDVALLNSVEGTVTVFPGLSGPGPAVFGGPLVDPARGYVSRVQAQTVVDANNDGFDDIVVLNGGATQGGPALMTALGDGKGGFFYGDASPGLNAGNFDFIEDKAADFNGDGLKDLVLHTFDGISLLLSNGDGTFRVSPVSLGAGFDCLTNYATAGDINGDGKLDLIVAYEGDRIYGCNGGSTYAPGFFTLLGNGDGTFQPATFTALGDEPFQPVLADVNGDGKLDLILSDVVFDALNEGIPATFKTFQLLGKGDGTFQASTVLANNYINAKTLVGDVNTDGNPDLIFLTEGLVDPDGGTFNPGLAGALPLLGHGDGTYTNGTEFAPGFFSAGGLLTDLNGDGKLDLLLSEFISYDFSDDLAGGVAALGNGDGTFTTAGGNFEVGDSSSSVLQGDFLKDGAPDALFVSGLSGTTLTMAQGGTTVSIQADNANIQQGGTVTFAVTVAASMTGRPQATGTITLVEGTTSLGSSSLSGGTASIPVSGLAVGAHVVTAIYSGDANFNVNGSASTTVQVLPAPAVTLSAAPTSLTLSSGSTGTVTLTAAANSSFTGSVTFAVSGAPSGMSVQINPATVTLTPNQSAVSTLVVSTVAPKSAMLTWPFAGGAGIALMGLALLVAPKRRKRTRRASVLAPALGCALFILIILTMAGCGGSGISVNRAPKGTTTLTVTATSSTAGSQPQTLSVTVTVN
jgi:hypothetical protein